MNRNSFLLFITFLFSIQLSQATIITVDNSATGGGQYASLQTAIDNATNGDTLHIIGTNTTYGTVNLTKSLTLIGAGYNPSNQLGLNTLIGNIFLSTSGTLTGGGSKIMGIQGGALSWASNTANFSNVQVERCRFSSINMNANSSNWIIQNCILGSIAINDNSNCIIRNNILTSFISNSDEPSVVISNNVVIYPSSSAAVFSSVQYATIANNIFYLGGSPQGCQNCVFNNNLAYATNNDTLPYGNNTGSGNIMGQDPLFKNVSAVQFDYQNDYNLQAGSPAENTGSDGTSMGIYGSINPFPDGGGAPYLTSPMPAIPQMVELDILNPNIVQGDSLEVHIKARKQN